jgi:hypothetical protein
MESILTLEDMLKNVQTVYLSAFPTEEVLETFINESQSGHAPLDYNKQISTSLAIDEKLEAKVLEEFVPYGNGYAGLICEIKQPPLLK